MFIEWLKINWANLITVLGLIITIAQIRKTKSAANEAKLAAESASKEIKRLTSISNLSKYVQISRNVRQHITDGHFANAVDKMDDVKEMLIEINEIQSLKNIAREFDVKNLLDTISDDKYTLIQVANTQDKSTELGHIVKRLDKIHTIFKTVETNLRNE